MSNWRSESIYLTRYTGSGALNTVAGFSVIFVLMAWGLSPLLANIGGYFVGFVLGFVLSKKFVFRSNGHFVMQSVRYLIAFTISFFFNLIVLHLALNLRINSIVAQISASMCYTLLMYILMRLYVFAPKTK